MEEIVNKACELGRMIQQTDVYNSFRDLSEKLNMDPQSGQLLEEYILLSENLHAREINGDTIENFELNRLNELKNSIEENDLLLEYIEAKNSYIKLLELIQASISSEDQ